MTNSEATRHSGHALKETEVLESMSRKHRPHLALLLDDAVAEGPGAAPLSDAGQTEGVTAGGQDAKPAV